VKRRGETLLVPPVEIDWIEAQGNYLALHVAGRTHLIRGVLGRMEQTLEPHRFARIHRGAIVNLERVRRWRAAASGDALIELEGGAELKVSRSYAKALKDRLPS
jgi:DNA-binding LytR/AlgR family response regulator